MGKLSLLIRQLHVFTIIEPRSFVAVLAVIALLAIVPGVASADHIGAHATPCNMPGTVGGGTLGVSPGPVGPPNSLGWDVGSGQCNGSFSVTDDAGFPGGALELALRAEQRRIGQVAQTGPNDYTVQTGPDVGPPAALNRTWWNFQGSIAYGGSIANLDSLMLEITTHVGPNLPAAPVVDLLAIRPFIDDRNNQPNATGAFADLYQFSQNPEFGWFSPTSDTDSNPTGAFDYDAPGAWTLTLTAVDGAAVAEVNICIHTPGETCPQANFDHFLSYAVKTTKKTPKFEKREVFLTDQFLEGLFRVDKPDELLNPADKNDEGISDFDTHLMSYKVKELGDLGHFRLAGILVENQFGAIIVDVKEPDRLLVPASKNLFEPPLPPNPSVHNVDHFLCYKIEEGEDSATIQVLVQDQFDDEPRLFDVKKPKRLCNPVDKNGEGIRNPDNHLLCYQVKPARGERKHEKIKGIFVNDQFALNQVDTNKERELCVPSTKTLPPLD